MLATVPITNKQSRSQARQGSCNTVHTGFVGEIQSVMHSNLGEKVWNEGKNNERIIVFEQRLLTVTGKRNKHILFSSDRAGQTSVFEIHVTGYKFLTEVKAYFKDDTNGPCVRALCIGHTSLHERYFKEGASIYEIIKSLTLGQMLNNPKFKLDELCSPFDLDEIKQLLSPYVQIFMFNQGDNKDTRLEKSWIEHGQLASCSLTRLLTGYYHGDPKKEHVDDLTKRLTDALLGRV